MSAIPVVSMIISIPSAPLQHRFKELTFRDIRDSENKSTLSMRLAFIKTFRLILKQ